MKNNSRNKNFKFWFSRWFFDHEKLSDILSVKTKTQMVLILSKIKIICGGKLNSEFISNIQVCLAQLRKLQKEQGDNGLIKYLKATSVLLQQSLSGYKIHDTSSIGPRISRTKGNRLPRIIPKRHRAIMLSSNKGKYYLIRFYLTLFYLYRVIIVKPYFLKLSTITDPGKEFSMEQFEGYYELFLKHFIKDTGIRWNPFFYMTKYFKVFPITKSSPFNVAMGEWSLWSTHPFVMMKSAMAIISNSQIWSIFQNLSRYYCNNLWFILNRARFSFPGHQQLGKLAFKEEPAGKLRVFAIVDCFTQWLLYPLHKIIFLILRRIPMDGTFNQVRPIHRLLRLNCKRYYSLDLTAATDRLPISIQKEILNTWFTKVPNTLGGTFEGKFGDDWASLLVNRNYSWQCPKGVLSKIGSRGLVRYSVGQPMGALSSWAMLALTHHFIVQVAAWKIGHPKTKLFTQYALLGDDLVVANKGVAMSYLKLMNKIGVGINLSKSILSHKGLGLEFAKRTFIDGIDVSPISFKDLSIALTPGNISNWVAFANTWKLDLVTQLKVLGHGFKARARLSSFRKMSHAVKLIFICNLAKLDINTDNLNLANRVPLDLDKNTELFKTEVIKPNCDLIWKATLTEYDLIIKAAIKWSTRNITVKPGTVVNAIQLFDVMAMAIDALGPKVNQEFVNLEAYKAIKAALDRGDNDFAVQLEFDTKDELIQTFNEYARIMIFRDDLDEYFTGREEFTSGNMYQNEKKIKYGTTGPISPGKEFYNIFADLKEVTSFNDALKVYLKLLKVQALIDLDVMTLKDKGVRKGSTKLPLQARLFRAWGRITHRIARNTH